MQSLMDKVYQLKESVGVMAACNGLNLPRASYYRNLKKETESVPSAFGKESPGEGERFQEKKPGMESLSSEEISQTRPSRSSHRALSEAERQRALEYLHSERFIDKAPHEIYATLLDEGIYVCSIRTLYRILHEEKEVRERRNQSTHPSYQKPELLATGPNQVWSWDITRLRGPVKWTYYYLYVIMDIYSRYVVGWMIATRESGDLAQKLIRETCEKQGISEGQLTLHSDRGSPMTTQTTAQLLANLGITKSYSRPHTSNDNPFSESHFKTLKYRPEFPDRFGSLEDSRTFCQGFFHWYNTEHRHSGIALLTPEVVHYGLAQDVFTYRQQILLRAFLEHPERFEQKIPHPPRLPKAVWINPPKNKEYTQELLL